MSRRAARVPRAEGPGRREICRVGSRGTGGSDPSGAADRGGANCSANFWCSERGFCGDFGPRLTRWESDGLGEHSERKLNKKGPFR